MVGASKILTVSYGTFSCTLEGFEEPFSTMKAIAEYFRDLAADDRYFGAEPPTPDAEMLHRIAEREIQRRVEAKISEHGIVLKADTPEGAQADIQPAATATAALMTAAAAPAPAAPAPMPVVEAAPEAFEEEIEVEPETAEEVFADYFDEEAEAAAPETADTDSVAAKLSRIRAVVAAAQAAPAAAAEDEETAADFAPAATVPAGDFGFELDLDDMPARSSDETVADVDALVALGEETVAEVDAFAPAEAEAEIAAEDDIAEVPVAEEEEAVAEDEAEDLVIETAEAEFAATEDDAEDEATDAAVLAAIGDLTTETDEEEAEAAEVDEAEASETDADEIEAAQAEEPDAEMPEAEMLAVEEAEALEAEELEADMAADESDAEEMEAEEAAVEGAEEEVAAALDLGAWRMDAEDDQVSAAEEAAEEEMEISVEPDAEAEDEIEAEDEDLVEAAFDAEDEITAEAEADGADEAEAEVPAGKPGFFGQAAARVIKIRKNLTAARDQAPFDEDGAEEPVAEEAEAETAQDAADDRSAAIFAALNEEAGIDEEFDEAEDVSVEDADDALLAGIGAAIGQTGLDQDDEDDLLRELADVAREARRDSHEGRAILEGNASDGEASVERLMEEAKSKLEGDESRRRFSAISHLKAAVVATVADRKLKLRDAPVSGEAEAGEEMERYRDDLSKAVRPRRPAGDSAPTTRRPTIETRQPPLVLVSEQRIDAPEESRKDAAVVRPRRISAGNLAVTDESDEDETTDAPLSPEEAKNFAEFADRLGAVNLSDMLEAAAAYTATVEGLPHFSRPQILRKVANVAEDEEYSREDGLRSFGMLLRQGKIQKIRRGQFTITEASKFMSEARRAAR